VVYTRELGDTSLTFIVSGMLWRNSMIMQDEETGTLWSHVTGEALEGPLVGRKLRVVPSVQTSWERWHTAHPRSEVLAKESPIEGSPYASYFADPDRAGIFPVRFLEGVLPAKEMVVGVAKGTDAVAIAWKKLAAEELVEVELGGEPVIVKVAADGGAVAFVARWQGRELDFQRTEQGWKDTATGSTWDLDRGECRAGELAGAHLPRIPARDAFWFAWSVFYPHTELVK